MKPTRVCCVRCDPRVQFNTTTFCNPCDVGTPETASCNAFKCPLNNFFVLHNITIFDQDGDSFTFFLRPDSMVNGLFGDAFEVDVWGGLAPTSMLNYELGPRRFTLLVDVTDNNPMGPKTSRFPLNITIVNVNDPPLLYSSNLTIVPENSLIGSVVYRFVPMDEDNDTVTFTILSGNINTGVYPPALPTTAFTLNYTSGELMPFSILNFELLPVYFVEMFMTDNGTPSLSTRIVLHVIIADRNDK